MTWLSRLDAGTASREEIGGKAASLLRLLGLGFPIPESLVIDTAAVDRLFDARPLCDSLRHKALSEIAGGLQAAVRNLYFPTSLLDEIAAETNGWHRYSVRSSSIQEDSEVSAWAGILESCVDIELEQVALGIRRCLSSMYSMAALEHAAQLNISVAELRMAIIIQEFIAGQVSGIGFSIDPVSNNLSSIVINAAATPNSQLTDGRIIPDSYVVDKQSGIIVDAYSAKPDQYCLRRSAIGAVSAEIASVERAFKHSVDVEWTMRDHTLVILQARRVTTFQASKVPAELVPSSYRFWWLDYDAMWQFDSGVRSFLANQDVRANHMHDVVYIRDSSSTRCFISVDDVLRLYEIGWKLQEEEKLSSFSLQSDNTIEHANALIDRLRSQNLRELPTSNIVQYLKKIDHTYQRVVSLYRICDPYSTNAIAAELAQFLKKEDLFALMRQAQPDLQQEFIDWELLIENEFNESAVWAHVMNYPWLVPNLSTRASVLSTMRQKYMTSHKVRAQDQHPRSIVEADLQPKARHLVDILLKISRIRTRLKLAFSSFDFFFIDFYQLISDQTGIAVDDLHDFYTIDELIELVSGNQNRSSRDALARYHQGRLIRLNRQEADRFWSAQRVSFDHPTNNPDELRGTVANLGTCEGKVHVVNCNDSAKTNHVREVMEHGDVLVSEMIQFNIMDLVQRAGALITDEGGILSHAAILARELGIPCIVGTQRATQFLRDGDRISIGEQGFIQRISATSQERLM